MDGLTVLLWLAGLSALIAALGLPAARKGKDDFAKGFSSITIFIGGYLFASILILPGWSWYWIVGGEAAANEGGMALIFIPFMYGIPTILLGGAVFGVASLLAQRASRRDSNFEKEL